jgi:glycosyltransferase involved in cell wall biosynthesis
MSHQSLSVIIPTYNRSHYLPFAVESVLNQTGVEAEVIVVDDGSTDDTAAVIERYARSWGERFKHIWQENSERCIARNNGLRHASGEFVAFLDSDDVWRPQHALRCVTSLREHPEVDVVYTECGLMAADGRPIREYVARPTSKGDQLKRDLCLKRLILHPTEMVIRRSALDGVEVFDPEIPGAEDWLLYVTLAGRKQFLRIPESTVWLRVHPKNTFGDPKRFKQSMMLAADKVIGTGLPQKLGIPKRRIIGINLTHCSYAYYLSGQFAEALQLLLAALLKYPWIWMESDFWRVLLRLSLGKRLSHSIRRARHQGRGKVIEMTSSQLD